MMPHWETEIKEKNPPNPKPKKQKKTKPLECMLSILIACLNLYISESVHNHFQWGFKSLSKIWVQVQIRNLKSSLDVGVKSQAGAIPRITCPFKHVQSSLSHMGTKHASCSAPNYLGEVRTAIIP